MMLCIALEQVSERLDWAGKALHEAAAEAKMKDVHGLDAVSIAWDHSDVEIFARLILFRSVSSL
jgi:hypothetical protein